jgi:hypothetical protein
MENRSRVVVVLTALMAALLFFSGDLSAEFLANPVDSYALLVVAASDTNTTIHRNLDPIDVNASLVGLARIYTALKDVGFEDSKIIVLYCEGGLQPNWEEKKCSKCFKTLKKHFGRQNMDASAANINSAVASLKEKLDDNDQFLFWINTHGAANGTLMMARHGKWSTGEIQNTFSGLKSKTNYLLFDSCFSGQIVDKVFVDNAVIFSTTQSNSPGWVDRTFTNCATYVECLTDKKFDKDKNGFVDHEEAFNATKSAAQEYEPKWRDYIQNKYRPPRPAPPGTVQRTSIIPKFKVGNSFVDAALGTAKSGDKKAPVKARKRVKRSEDPGKALMKKAKLHESGRDYITAIKMYKKIEGMGKHSMYSKEARQRIEGLLAKKDVAAEYEEYRKQQQLKEDLAMAESFALAGSLDDVIEYCNKVLEASPGSSEGKSAKILLKWANEAKELEKKKENE